MLDKVIGSSWVPIIGDEFNKEYLQKLAQWLANTRESLIIYPASEDVFKALQLCPYGQVKVVVIGQDPYHNGVADGLCFSYKEGKKAGNSITQSLDVIFKEIENDVYNGFNVNYNYQLDYLAKQGVLLLNTILTVQKGKPLSHANFGWETLTSKIVLSQIFERSPKVFLLWGREAKNFFKRIIVENNIVEEYLNHLILEAPHPASDLYKKDQFGDITPNFPNTFSGCKHFSQVNKFLESKTIEPINWFNTHEPFNNEDLKLLYQPF